jgi:nicotinamide mononucleotide adenylyltransferase
MYDSKKPTVQLLGRWQPWHDGHTALFKKAIEKTGQVVVLIRDMPVSKNNPYTGGQVAKNIIDALSREGYVFKHDYDIISVPNIVNITYGRDVGYTITQEHLGPEIEAISATKIRNEKRTNTV